MEIVTQDQAHARGLVRYFTGKPCRKGHISERYVLNGACIACIHRKRAPVSQAWNMVTPPSGLAFPADTPTPLTPQLVSKVWGYVLAQMPQLVDRALAELGQPTRAQYRQQQAAALNLSVPRLKPHCVGCTYEGLRAQGLTDGQMYTAGMLEDPIMSDSFPAEWIAYGIYLLKGGTHAEAVANNWIVGY